MATGCGTLWTCGRPKIDLQFGAPDAPIPLNMKRFLPYLRYLRGRRIALMSALIFGAISAVVYGWGLPVADLLRYFWILVACLMIVVGLAVLAGFILRKISHRHDDQ